MSSTQVSIQSFENLSPHQLYRILQLRAEVFIVEQKCVYQDLDGVDLASFHISIESPSSELLAYARIVPPGVRYPEWSLGRVVSRTSLRGRGFGRQIVQTAIAEIEKRGGEAIRISAQSYLVQFYKSFEFSSVGDEYLEDDIPHQQMLRARSS